MRDAKDVLPHHVTITGNANVQGAISGVTDLAVNAARKALEGFRKVDLGGLELSYSPTDHSGLDYVDLSIIGADGRFRR